MNKSLHTVTIPIKDYEELYRMKSDFENLRKELGNLFDTSHYDSGENYLLYNVEKSMELAHKYLPLRLKDINVLT